MKREFKADKRSTAITVTVIIIVILMALTVAAVLFRYIDSSVFNERRIYLSAQTETTTGLINKTLLQYKDYAEISARTIESDLRELQDLPSYMKYIERDLFLNDTKLVLVDENCTWYGDKGRIGRVSDVSRYEDATEDSICYITREVDTGIDCFVFRVRLNESHPAKTADGTVNIRYVLAICYMDVIDGQIAIAFPYNSNRFIIDENGLMLMKDLRLGQLIGGTNFFTKYTKIDLQNSDTCEEQVDAIKNKETVVGEFKLDGTNYYICTASLDINDWYMSYIIPTDSLTAGNYIDTVTVYIILICTVLALAILFAIRTISKMKYNQKLLDKEKETNLILEQTTRAKSAFLSNMSHDIRTPINGIMGMTVLARKENNPPKTAECLTQIDRASRHLLSLVNDVLDMSSIENGKVVITLKPVKMIALLDNCADILGGQMQGRQLEIIRDFKETSSPYLMIDELHTQQILINILSNAVKYTPDGGKIFFRMCEISHSETSSVIRIEVEDTGIGMKQEFLERIWDQFSQENGGTRTKYKGTGLGMAITKNYVELMNGTITVESEYEKGSKFTVEIPFDRADEAELAAEIEIGESIDGVKILLAEDNDINLMIIRELLADEGAIVTEAVDGKEAFDTFTSNPEGTFDILLLDVLMPEMTGIEVTEKIRRLDRPDAAAIPIIAMTANAFAEDIKATEEAGMNAHLSKPVDMSVVVKTISKFYKTVKNEEAVK